MARIIKRYANRKLYDTAARRHVTLAEMEALVQQGEPIKVIEQSTGADITYSILSKIVSAATGPEHEESKKSLLIELIKSPRQAMMRYVKDSVSAGLDTVSQVGEKIEQQLKGMITPNENGRPEDVVETYVNTLSAIIDDRVHAAVGNMDLPTRAELDRLERILRNVARRMETLERHDARGARPRSKRGAKKRTSQ